MRSGDWFRRPLGHGVEQECLVSILRAVLVAVISSQLTSAQTSIHEILHGFTSCNYRPAFCFPER